MKTLTIRNVPDEVAGRLTAQARRGHRSRNAFVVDLLSSVVPGAAAPRPPVADFSQFCGVWSEAEADAFDAAVADFRKIRRGDWS